MPKISLSHIEAALLFSLLTSVVLGVVSRKSNQERFRYGMKCFAYFVTTLIVAGWLMYFGHR